MYCIVVSSRILLDYNTAVNDYWPLWCLDLVYYTQTCQIIFWILNCVVYIFVHVYYSIHKLLHEFGWFIRLFYVIMSFNKWGITCFNPSGRCLVQFYTFSDLKARMHNFNNTTWFSPSFPQYLYHLTSLPPYSRKLAEDGLHQICNQSSYSASHNTFTLSNSYDLLRNPSKIIWYPIITTCTHFRISASFDNMGVYMQSYNL